MNNAIPFNDFWSTLDNDEREQLAAAAETSVAYLYQVATGRRRAGLSIFSRLNAADSRISLAMLRPDLVSEGTDDRENGRANEHEYRYPAAALDQEPPKDEEAPAPARA